MVTQRSPDLNEPKIWTFPLGQSRSGAQLLWLGETEGREASLSASKVRLCRSKADFQITM